MARRPRRRLVRVRRRCRRLKESGGKHGTVFSGLLAVIDCGSIVAVENQCTPDRTTVVRSVCKSFQLLLSTDR
ncbi:hypothetical protein ELS20_02020 [Haloarcula hispanica]|uniref:Uncharacterized protein n=1 Tax=Haloarcula hispanica TaxID=51589 RepID=A0A482T7L3_HALHI|nr:hypothetical protein ELS20_02020 [Haloarcula hispanica]